MTAIEIWPWAAGIVVTVIVGAFWSRSVRKRKLSQKQKAGKGSVAIQSGRDTNIKDGE